LSSLSQPQELQFAPLELGQLNQLSPLPEAVHIPSQSVQSAMDAWVTEIETRRTTEERNEMIEIAASILTVRIFWRTDSLCIH
jgi:hypothetical protein